MSQIFDALLRAEADRDGSSQATQRDATEILQKVENQVVSMWVPGAPVAEHDTAHPAQFSPLAGHDTASEYAESSDALHPRASRPSQGLNDAVLPFPSLPVAALPPESRVACLVDAESPMAEAFRLLTVRLRDLRRARPLKTVLITSTVPREGKSTVSANLACTLARKTEERTLLLEGDVRRPSLSEMFHLRSTPGLCEWLQGKRELSESIYRLDGAGAWILPAGKTPKSPLEYLQSERLPLLINQLSSWFDWIVIDSPPILPLADTSVWARIVDGILLVTRQGTTEKQQLERGLQSLDTSKVIGALLNCAKVSTYKSYYGRYLAAS